MANDPAARLISRLSDAGETLAVCESLTGGLLGATLTDVAGSSLVFRGGVISYAIAVKTHLVGVPADLIRREGVVSEQTARAMAEGVRRVCETDWGIATTGVAGPEPHGGQPPGTVWLAVAGPGGEVAESLIVSKRLYLSGDRSAIRATAVGEALRLALECSGIIRAAG